MSDQGPECSVCTKVAVTEHGDMCPACGVAFEAAANEDPRLRKVFAEVNTSMKAQAWQNGMAEAVDRMREHLADGKPIRFDARDRMALAFILEHVERG